MKATEVIKLAEMINTFRPKHKEDKMPRRRGPPHYMQRMDDKDVVALLHKRLAEADTLKKLLDDREKANKKEEKKHDKELTANHIAIFLVLTYPIIGLAMFLLLRR